MRIEILSPHRDDAAFSCGLTMLALLQAGAQLTVLNVFTQSDYAVDLRTVDASLPLVEAVSRARRVEDEYFVQDVAACAGRPSSAVQLLDLDELDAPLRLAVRTEQVLEAPLSHAEVQQAAQRLARKIGALTEFDLVFAPLALGDHIDHRIVREATKLFAGPDRTCLYEDLPYACRIAAAERKEASLRAAAWKPAQDFVQHTLHVPNGPHLKHRFAMHYPSQIAPEVAEEMAAYAAQWSGAESGGERWWAHPSCGAALAGLLHSASAACHVVEEPE